MDPIPCSWWEPTGIRWHELHVWCACGEVTKVPLGASREDTVDWDTAPWPERCSHCGRGFDYEGDDELSRSSSSSHEMRCPATGEVIPCTRELPAGALYDYVALYPSVRHLRTGEDGRRLQCVLPNGRHWSIDSRASNCGSPEDEVHRCWCRHGDPTEPSTVHVDKNCNTCSAGAGSIQSGDFHGFLHSGQIVGG